MMGDGGTGLTLGAGYMLVGLWQPFVMLIPIIGWAWLVSNVLDKHAARFFLGRETWGLVHLIAGLAGVLAVVLMPVPGIGGFAAGMLVMIAIYALDIGLFVAIANKDERVPEHARLTLDMSKWKEARAARKGEKSMGTSKLKIASPSKAPMKVPEKGTPDYELRVAAEEVLLHGREVRASQIDIMPAGEKQYAASFLVDGVRQQGEPLAPQQAVAVIDFWKKCGELDVGDRRRKQTAMITVTADEVSTPIRLTTSGSQAGMKLTMLFDPAASVRRKLDKIGLLDPPQLKAVRELVEDGSGVVLLAAPSDNGRTTTLYALLKEHDAYTSNVQTLEFEIDDAIEGVRQTPFDATADGADYATQLRSMLRRDPDVVGAAEVPDVQTAQEISKADLERTRVYASIRADGATAALQIWCKAVGDKKAAANALRGVIAHRLVRKLCENCRVAYTPPAEMLSKLGLPAEKVKQLHKKGGQVLVRSKPETCPVCNGIGYFGQIGVFEVLPIGPDERALIAKENWSGLRAEMRKKQMPSLAQVALRRAVEGLTSVEEVTRVTAPAKKPSGGSGRKAS